MGIFNFSNATRKGLLLLVAAGSAVSAHAVSRGYVTTPQELKTIRQKADAGTQPYRSAYLSLANFANTGSFSAAASTANPTRWPYGSISGAQTCSGTYQPAYMANGGPLAEAKAMMYHLTGDARYAASVREKLMLLTTTSYYNGESYSGGNQCILNISWYMPPWISAADLINDYAGFTAADKQKFKQWLATEIYKKTDWSSGRRSNNWGSAGSYTSAMIADYLTGSGILMVDRTGARIDSRAAYLKHKSNQIARMNGNTFMDNYGCPTSNKGQGIRPDGGIPWELVRGTSGCDGKWISTTDASWTYMITHLGPTIAHAEMLQRRGDKSLFLNITSTGAGSLLRSIYFLIHNPNDVSKSVPWKDNRKQGLELVYRFFASLGTLDPYIGKQLGIGTSSRHIGGINNPLPHFGTITHGFAVGEKPVAPPVTPAP